MSVEAAKAMERELITEHKKELDKQHAPHKPLIVGTKCKRCGRLHSLVRYYWHKDVKGDPSLKINIQAPDDKTLQQIYAAENALATIGIHFDTGYGDGRDWEFDWSLSGEHFLFDEATKKYVPLDRTKKSEETKHG